MAIEFAPLTGERLEDLESLLLPVWNRRWGPTLARRILQWRFLERAEGEAVLAYDGARAVGFIDSFFRLHRSRSGPIRVREPADWYCHPDHRPMLGLRLMRRLMNEPEPVLVVGGNATTVRILPKLRYRELPELASYMLPTGTGVLIKGLSRAFRFAVSAVPSYVARPLSMRTGWGSRSSGGLPEILSHPLTRAKGVPELSPPHPWYDLSPILRDRDLEWYEDAPREMGDFVGRAFETSDGARGLTLSRIYEEGRFRAARLLHIDADTPSVPLYASMIESTVGALMCARPQWITARSSCPIARAALERMGFRKYDVCKAFWWHREMPPPEGPVNLAFASGDEALLPYPAGAEPGSQTRAGPPPAAGLRTRPADEGAPRS